MRKYISVLLIFTLILSSAAPSFAITRGDLGEIVKEIDAEKIKEGIKEVVEIGQIIIDKIKDIADHWAKEYIEKLISSGGINGYPDGTFKPDSTIKVGEFTKILISSLGYEDIKVSESGHWSLNYISKAKELGIILEGEFTNGDLDRNIIRAEMARMIVRALDEEYPSNLEEYKTLIKDYNNIPEEFKDYVLKAYSKGIITGYPDGTFKYDESATRAEASTMIVRLLDESERKVPKLEENEEGYKDVTEIAEKELLTNYIPDEDNGILEYRVGNRYERVKYVYKISISDLPVKIGEHILYSIEPEIEIVGTGKNPTFIVHQTVDSINTGLYMNITDKDFKVLRPRNNYRDWTTKLAPTPQIDKYGNKIYKTYYGVIVLDDLPDWKTYRGKDAYNLIFNDAKSDYAVIVENAFNK